MPEREFLVFVISERPDITHTPPIQIACRRMVDGMAVPPCIVGREREDAGENTDNVIRLLRFEERAVSAVMKDDEHAHHEQRGKKRKQQRQPVRDVEATIGEIPEDEKRGDAVEHLPEAAS